MRREDWQPRLWATLETAKSRPFTYGACVALAAECVDAMTDSNFRLDVQPLVDGALERPIELEELQRQVTLRLGAPQPLNWTGQGDLVLLELPPLEGTGNGPALGICTGHLVACACVPVGVTFLRLNKVKRSWAVK